MRCCSIPDVVIVLLGTNDTKPENWEKRNEFPKLYNGSSVVPEAVEPAAGILWLPPYVAKKGAFGINEAGVKEQIPMIQDVANERGAA